MVPGQSPHELSSNQASHTSLANSSPFPPYFPSTSNHLFLDCEFIFNTFNPFINPPIIKGADLVLTPHLFPTSHSKSHEFIQIKQILS